MPTVSFTLHLRPDGDALHRVLTVCRRRQLVIETLSYRGGELAVTLSGELAGLRQIHARLDALVDVLDVQRSVAPGEPPATLALTASTRREAAPAAQRSP